MSAATAAGEPRSGTTLVIVASALGTVFEWYDFFVYGTLATIIAQHFFPSGNSAVSLLIALATFGVGFGMRPLGAILFGVLGDRLGRKYTFLATVAVMGGATAGVGLLPTYERIGIAAPVLLVLLRVFQGLALGGEYGGAAIYVAEHAPAHRRGLFTSFIQAGVVGGFLLSLCVVLAANAFVPRAEWTAWGWRIPFLFSIVLLAVSLWLRARLHESPVFKAMQKEGTIARNPLRESFDSWAKWRRVLVVLFGIAAGLTVVFYTAQFQSLYFVQNALRIEDNAARLIVGVAATAGLGWYILFGWLSDKVGRKWPIAIGYAATLVLLFPLFHWMMAAGNPGLATAMARAPVVVIGTDCRFDPFATHGQATPCGRVLDALTKRGVPYTKQRGSEGVAPAVTIAGDLVATDDATLDAALARAGYRLGKVTPTPGQAAQVALAIILVGMLSGATYGPVAALLVEMFPARVRYTSMSIPYHIGSGYFGGFLPFIFQYIVARTGDPFAGLWYTIVVAAVALVVVVLWLPETAARAGMSDDDVALAGRLADAAGQVIRPFFRARFTVETKADASPVTQADRAAEAAIRAILAAERPNDGVIGEEYGADRPEAERVWVIDPIDGTRAFMAGRPLFGTLIALLAAGRPVLGVIDQPIARDRWLGAAGRPTTLNGIEVGVRTCPALATAQLATTGPNYIPPSDRPAFERLRAGVGDTLWGGDCHNYGLLASGHLDLVVEAGLKLHDFAALAPVVEGAGGRMTDWRGRPLDADSDGRVIAAGDPHLVDAVVAALA